MSLATLAQNQAAMAINRYGAIATLAQVTPGTYDPSTGTTPDSTVTTPTRAILDASSLAGLGAKFGADLVRSGDLKATIPAKGLTSDPKGGDQLTVRGSTLAVVAVRPLFVGASPVTYELLVRGA